MTTANELARVLEANGSVAEAIAATGMNVTREQYARAFRRAARRLATGELADEEMRISEAIRLLESREWSRLPINETIDRSMFLLRAFQA